MAIRKSKKYVPQAPALPAALVSELLQAMPTTTLPKKRETLMKKNLMAKIATLAHSQTQQQPQRKSAIKSTTTRPSPAKPPASNAVPGITTIRMSDAAAGRWYSQEPGIDAKILFDDGRTMTWLARFAAGARLAAHLHHGVEESTVLQGYCFLGNGNVNAANLNDESYGMRLNPGDYQLAEDGSTHPEVYSPEGCVLLIRSASLKVLQVRETNSLRV